MRGAPLETTATIEYADTEVERIEQWRSEELERAGFDPQAAATVASRHDIDLHVATDLLRRGCPQELALQILL